MTINYYPLKVMQNGKMNKNSKDAEENGIYLMYYLNSYGDFHYNWDINAYNAENGGPCSTVADFWTNTTAIKYQKNLLRYIFARWGYSRALGIVEYWNESDVATVGTTTAIRGTWHQEMDDEWKSMDFYGRATTTSFAWKDHSNQPHQYPWTGLDMLDAANNHYYSSSSNIIDVWEAELDYIISRRPSNTPVFMGECGINDQESSTDENLRYVHDSV